MDDQYVQIRQGCNHVQLFVLVNCFKNPCGIGKNRDFPDLSQLEIAIGKLKLSVLKLSAGQIQRHQ